MSKPLELLQKYWGHTSFRPLQEEIINTVLEKRDTLALLPTGGGKSICFQIPALIEEGICIVVSPLIALIEDQVNTLKRNGIKAIALTGGLKESEIGILLDNCIYGDYKFLYLSPERIQQDIVKDRIKQMYVNFIAVDEAHCISQWGNDFRPAYQNINTLREIIPEIPCIALTATATSRVVEDIKNSLHLKDVAFFKQSFIRKNIAYHVVTTEDKQRMLSKTLRKHHEPCIVYTRNRKSTHSIHEVLDQQGFSSIFFHGGLSSKEKKKHLEQWLSGNVQTMVATNAFGMGIDKPNVKNVIHIHLPDSLENYYQEAGRAGRNGMEANAVIFMQSNDINVLQRQFINNLPTIPFLKHVYRKLCNYFQIAYGEGYDTKHALAFYDFCKTYQLPTQQTYQVLQTLDRHSIIHLSKNFRKKTTIQFKVDQYTLLNYLDKTPQHSIITKAILRTYGGIFEQKVNINTALLAQKLGLQQSAIEHTLEQLANVNIIELYALQTDAEITFLVAREDDKTIHPIAKEVLQQNEIKKQRIQAVIAYINNSQVCKQKQLLSYFGEESHENCGKCSVCISKYAVTVNRSEKENIIKAILQVIATQELNSVTICELLPYQEASILEGIQLLLEAEKIRLTKTNTYTIL